MRLLSKDEIEREIEETDMETQGARERAWVGKHISFRRTELTAAEMIERDNELRKNAPAGSSTQSAQLAKQLADAAARRAASKK
jgi:hypothetical protein